jgi:hypothetical protein
VPAKKSSKAPKNSSKEELGEVPSSDFQVPHNLEDAVYDSIGAAAAGENIDLEVLKRAKRMGAPGFKGSRVYFTKKLRAWLEDNWDRLTDQTKKQIEEERLRKLRQENDLWDKLYVQRAAVETWLGGRAEKIQNLLRKKLRNELPPKIAGLKAPEISAKMETDVIVPICKLLRFDPEESEAGEQKEKKRKGRAASAPNE